MYYGFIILWLYRRAAAKADAWLESRPYSLTTFSVKPRSLATMYAIRRWRAAMPVAMAFRPFGVLGVWRSVMSLMEREDMIPFNEPTILIGIELDVWRWHDAGRKTPAEVEAVRSYVPLRPYNSRFASIYHRDSFLRLVHVLDNPHMVPYWELGLSDNEVETLIAAGVDVEMARALRA